MLGRGRVVYVYRRVGLKNNTTCFLCHIYVLTAPSCIRLGRDYQFGTLHNNSMYID